MSGRGVRSAPEASRGGRDTIHHGAAADFLAIGVAYALSALLAWFFIRNRNAAD